MTDQELMTPTMTIEGPAAPDWEPGDRIVDQDENGHDREWTIALNREQRDELRAEGWTVPSEQGLRGRAAGCFRDVRHG